MYYGLNFLVAGILSLLFILMFISSMPKVFAVFIFIVSIRAANDSSFISAY